ncbi:MAG: HIT family protein [Phycisphaerales bacterium]|nr:HIT family protein [Phycisphaerales bacterium]
MTHCPACERLRAPAADPLFIAELRQSIAMLHEHQAYPGWCVLFVKDHAEHLHELDPQVRADLMLDVADAAAALNRAFAPRRINYECLGNQLAHIHWHVIPRYQPPLDPDPRSVVWVRDGAQLHCGSTQAERLQAIRALRAAGLVGQA